MIRQNTSPACESLPEKLDIYRKIGDRDTGNLYPLNSLWVSNSSVSVFYSLLDLQHLRKICMNIK